MSDRWLREQVAPAYDALKADPSRAVTVEPVRERLAAEHETLGRRLEPGLARAVLFSRNCELIRGRTLTWLLGEALKAAWQLKALKK